MRCPISLAPVFEPIADLRQGEARLLRQFPLLFGIGVSVPLVHQLERRPGLFFEAVHNLLAVPDGHGERVLFAEAVLIHGAQRPLPHLFSLLVVRFQPELKIIQNI